MHTPAIYQPIHLLEKQQTSMKKLKMKTCCSKIIAQVHRFFLLAA
jgi:hypothetical protein